MILFFRDNLFFCFPSLTSHLDQDMLLRYLKGHFYQVNCKWCSYYRKVMQKRRKEVSLSACKMHHKNEKRFGVNAYKINLAQIFGSNG